MPIAARDPHRLGRRRPASIECEDLFALPGRITDPELRVPQIGWSDSSSGERWLALGEAESFGAPAGAGFESAVRQAGLARERLRAIRDAAGDAPFLRCFGGIAFDPRDRRGGEGVVAWAARFVLPRVLARQVGDRTDLLSIGIPEARAREALEEAAAVATRGGSRPRSRIVARERPSPDRRAGWTQGIREVLDAIEEGRVRKVVLSRDIDLEAAAPIDPWEILRVAHDQAAFGSRFCIRLDPGGAFVGASPEKLVLQRGRVISCDCIAGTIARGTDPGEDALQESRLRASEKDRREHHLVLEGIREAIAPLARWCEAPSSPEILPLPKILHLSSPVRAWLRDEVEIADLIHRLHPTAAVAGAPRETAMDLIRRVEGRSRGWYAGAVGWIGPEGADLAVAIRSAIVRGSSMTVHGGAGIVRGSHPDSEWEETARKAASFMSLFAERIP